MQPAVPHVADHKKGVHMPYDFNQHIERRGTDSLKYDFAAQRGKAADLLPMWVADMDFRLPEEILDPLRARLEHGVFGYSVPNEDYYDIVRSWFERRYGWQTQRSWMVRTPGVVFAFATAIRAYSEPGDAVIIQQPVYYLFEKMISANARRVVNAPLVYDEAHQSYSIDFDEFERVVAKERPKVFLLCNPHNPSGRVWSADELRRLGEICLEHGVVVVSDEIHADFTRHGYEHTVFASLGPEHADNSVICTSPSKTFNIAGLQISNTFIPNPKLRAAFHAAHYGTGYDELNSFGIVACRACYQHGEPWLEALMEHIEGNLALMKEAFARREPRFKVVEPGSTYLPWVDCKALGVDDERLRQLVEDEAKLWLDMGTMFGQEGSGFIRFNIACPEQTVREALERLCTAAEGLG